MSVKKSLRTVSRYIQFEFISAAGMRSGEFEENLRKYLKKMLGLLSAPKLKLISTSTENVYVLRCDLESFMRVRQALLFFYGRDYRIKLLKSSGTIKSLA